MSKATKTAAKVNKAEIFRAVVKPTAKAASKPQASKAAKPTKDAAKVAATPQKAAGAEAKPTLHTAFREGSNFAACTIALANLGVGKLHPFDAVVAEVKKVMGRERMAEFTKHDPKTADKRILTNLTTIGRNDHYGDPIRACGYRVERDGRKKVQGLFKA